MFLKAWFDDGHRSQRMDCITTRHGFRAIGRLFGDYGQHDSAGRYSPSPIVEVISKVRSGNPDPKHISTSYAERSNLTIRMQIRRFTRLTNAFSKKLANHMGAVALYVAHYNFCRVHEALRVTPAMHLGVTDHIWTIGELVDAALDGVFAPSSPKSFGRFTVIKGGAE